MSILTICIATAILLLTESIESARKPAAKAIKTK